MDPWPHRIITWLAARQTSYNEPYVWISFIFVIFAEWGKPVRGFPETKKSPSAS
jgi:hypothetical protein